MRREIDNRMKRMAVFAIITTAMKFKACPELLEESLEDLTTLVLGGLVMTLNADKYEPYPFDVGTEWIEMYQGVEGSLEKQFPELFSKLIIS